MRSLPYIYGHKEANKKILERAKKCNEEFEKTIMNRLSESRQKVQEILSAVPKITYADTQYKPSANDVE